MALAWLMARLVYCFACTYSKFVARPIQALGVVWAIASWQQIVPEIIWGMTVSYSVLILDKRVIIQANRSFKLQIRFNPSVIISHRTDLIWIRALCEPHKCHRISCTMSETYIWTQIITTFQLRAHDKWLREAKLSQKPNAYNRRFHLNQLY